MVDRPGAGNFVDHGIKGRTMGHARVIVAVGVFRQNMAQAEDLEKLGHVIRLAGGPRDFAVAGCEQAIGCGDWMVVAGPLGIFAGREILR